MYRLRFFFIAISLFITGLTGVQASSFNERFRSFILDETDAATKVLAIDGASQQCMSCHNGALGRHIQIKDATRPMQFSGFGSRNHPVGMQYTNYTAQQPYNFRDRSALNPQIQLVDGRVGCLSCHKLKQKEILVAVNKNTTAATTNSCISSKMLTVGPHKSDLCMSCHKI